MLIHIQSHCDYIYIFAFSIGRFETAFQTFFIYFDAMTKMWQKLGGIVFSFLRIIVLYANYIIKYLIFYTQTLVWYKLKVWGTPINCILRFIPWCSLSTLNIACGEIKKGVLSSRHSEVRYEWLCVCVQAPDWEARVPGGFRAAEDSDHCTLRHGRGWGSSPRVWHACPWSPRLTKLEPDKSHRCEATAIGWASGRDRGSTPVYIPVVSVYYK